MRKKHCCLSGNSNSDENCHGLSDSTAVTKSVEYYYCLVDNVWKKQNIFKFISLLLGMEDW